MLAKLHRFALRIIPNFLLAPIGLLLGIFYKKKSYSQYGEDLILLSFFRKVGLKVGTYVDIGAFHPYWISNTKLLHDQGWRGCVVDIDALKLWGFRVARGGRCKRVLAAIGADESARGSNVTVYKFKRFLSEIDTLSEAQAKKYASDWGYSYSATRVPYVPVNDLLLSCGHIDFLNIDVEGLDSVILGAIDFSVIRPTVIVFEDNEHWGGRQEVQTLLQRAGYDLLFLSGGSVAYYLRGSI
jgi:hypothetical protein